MAAVLLRHLHIMGKRNLERQDCTREIRLLVGGEGPVAQLWYYASENLYLLHLACLIVWFLSGILLCLCRWSFRTTLLLAHFCLGMLWLAAALITIC